MAWRNLTDGAAVGGDLIAPHRLRRRLIVGDAMYDVKCAAFVRDRMQLLRTLAERENHSVMKHWRRVYEALGLS